MKERGLTLSAEKTHITHIDDGFDFLGQNVRKYNGKLSSNRPRRTSKRSWRKSEGRQGNQTTAGNLILLLNPVIRGWAKYHRHVVSKKIFQDVDSAIFEMLWQWARKRHHNKPRRWIKDKYFHDYEERHWVFSRGSDWARRSVGNCSTLPSSTNTYQTTRQNPGRSEPF